MKPTVSLRHRPIDDKRVDVQNSTKPPTFEAGMSALTEVSFSTSIDRFFIGSSLNK